MFQLGTTGSEVIVFGYLLHAHAHICLEVLVLACLCSC
jgi:hypothetical protein